MARSGSIGGTIFAILFGLVFASAGGFFCYVLLRDVARDLDSWIRWSPASCRILRSEVVRASRDENPYELHLLYEYDTAGATFQSAEYTPKRSFGTSKGYDTYHAPNKVASRYPAESRTECFYNPSDPADACLARIVPWYGLFALIPLIFVLVGVAIISAPFLPEHFGMSAAREKPLSARAAGPSARAKRIGMLLLAGFFSIFLIGGVLMLANFLVVPWLENSRAEHWEEASCRIVSSEVIVHRGDESDSYTPDILFEFDVRGTTYRSSRLNFLSSFGVSSRAEAKSITRMLPPGAKTPCYFNPDNPNEAVIQRVFEFPIVLTVVGSLFSLIGAVAFAWALRRAVTTSPEDDKIRLAARPPTTSAAVAAPDELVIQSTQTKRLGMIAVGIFVNFFWNGIVGVIVYQLLKPGFQYWHIFPLLFLSIFGLIGLLLFYVMIVHPIFLLLSPTLRIGLKPGVIRGGTTLAYQWSIAGRISRAESLRLQLEGVEEATYTRGTDSVTDKSVFEVIDLGSVDGHSLRLGAGTGSSRIPDGLLPSLATGNNRIVWYVRVLLDVKGLPDVFEETEIEVAGKEER